MKREEQMLENMLFNKRLCSMKSTDSYLEMET